MPIAGGHHRSDLRDGPWQSFCRRKAVMLQRLGAPGRVLERMLLVARPVGVDTYVIPGGAALFLKARVVLDEWRPLANDTEGQVFE